MLSVYAHKTTVTGDGGNLGDMMGFHIADWLIGPDAYHRRGMTHRDALGGDSVALVGSVIAALVNSPVRVLGGGLINGNARTYAPEVRIDGVRGFLTQSVIERDAKRVPEVIGDPGMLLPRISPLPPRVNRKPLGFIIHDVDREEFARCYPEHLEDIVDNYAARDDFVAQLARYDAVVSTSLHGCVFAHAYGVPVAPFTLTDKVFGGDFKFRDHYSAFGLDVRRLPLDGDASSLLEQVWNYPQPTRDQVERLVNRQLELILPALGADS